VVVNVEPYVKGFGISFNARVLDELIHSLIELREPYNFSGYRHVEGDDGVESRIFD